MKELCYAIKMVFLHLFTIFINRQLQSDKLMQLAPCNFCNKHVGQTHLFSILHNKFLFFSIHNIHLRTPLYYSSDCFRVSLSNSSGERLKSLATAIKFVVLGSVASLFHVDTACLLTPIASATNSRVILHPILCDFKTSPSMLAVFTFSFLIFLDLMYVFNALITRKIRHAKTVRTAMFIIIQRAVLIGKFLVCHSSFCSKYTK